MKLKLTLLFSLLSTVIFAQWQVDLQENVPYIDNGIEYTYLITNESTVKEYNRYEVSITATNKSGCQLIYIQKDNFASLFDDDPAAIARFDCINANGKRLTSKGGNLRAKPFFVPYSRSQKNAEGKTVTITERIQGGFILANGQTISNNFIVLTDAGKPKFKLRIQNFTDLSNQ